MKPRWPTIIIPYISPVVRKFFVNNVEATKKVNRERTGKGVTLACPGERRKLKRLLPDHPDVERRKKTTYPGFDDSSQPGTPRPGQSPNPPVQTISPVSNIFKATSIGKCF